MVRRKIYGITVSKNYSDFLEILIRNNSSTFDTWFIVTQEDDSDTINIIKKYNKQNIEIIYYPLEPNKHKPNYTKNKLTDEDLEISHDPLSSDEKKSEIIFDKGGGLCTAQKILYNKYAVNDTDVIIVIDSDVVFPRNIKHEILNIEMEKDILYGASRIDFFKESDFLNKKNKKKYHRENVLDGYFQMYQSDSSKLFKRTIDCGWVDLEFTNQFSDFKIIKTIEISHLGRPGINWKGRQHECFLFDTKNISYLKKIANENQINYKSHYTKSQIVELIEKKYNIFSINAVKDKPSFPKFVVSGFPRSGTNFFVNQTENHSDINYAKDHLGGSLNYCSSVNYEKSSWKKNHKRYMNYFLRCGNCWGDYGSAYLAAGQSVESINRMKHLYIDNKWNWMPDVKFIFILRNPIERLLSQYEYLLKNLPTSATWNWLKPGFSLKENILEELSHIGMVSSKWPLGKVEVKGGLLLDGYYANALKYFYDTLKPSKHNVLILSYEKLARGCEQEQSRFFDFMELETELVFKKNKLKERRLDLSEEVYELLNDFYGELNNELFELIGNQDEW